MSAGARLGDWAGGVIASFSLTVTKAGEELCALRPTGMRRNAGTWTVRQGMYSAYWTESKKKNEKLGSDLTQQDA